MIVLPPQEMGAETRNPADSPSGELPGPLPPATADDQTSIAAEQGDDQ